jgi:hypothetical protein
VRHDHDSATPAAHRTLRRLLQPRAIVDQFYQAGVQFHSFDSARCWTTSSAPSTKAFWACTIATSQAEINRQRFLEKLN